MKCTILFFVLNMILITACTRTSRLVKYDMQSSFVKKINYLGEKRTGHIELITGESIKTDYIYIKNGSLTYRTRNEKISKVLPMNRIQKIYFKDRVVSIFDGIWIGFFGGFLGCYIYTGGDTDSEMIGLAYLGFATGGSCLGSIVGGIKGAKLEYELNNR